MFFIKSICLNSYCVTVTIRIIIRLEFTALHCNQHNKLLRVVSTDTETGMLPGVPGSAICVQKFDDSLYSAIRITYRISLRSSSLREPRHPSLKVVMSFLGLKSKNSTAFTRTLYCTILTLRTFLQVVYWGGFSFK